MSWAHLTHNSTARLACFFKCSFLNASSPHLLTLHEVKHLQCFIDFTSSISKYFKGVKSSWDSQLVFDRIEKVMSREVYCHFRRKKWGIAQISFSLRKRCDGPFDSSRNKLCKRRLWRWQYFRSHHIKQGVVVDVILLMNPNEHHSAMTMSSAEIYGISCSVVMKP